MQMGCRYTHPAGRGGFASVEHGQQFREAAYREAELKMPQPWKLGGAPRTITLLSAVTGEMVFAHIVTACLFSSLGHPTSVPQGRPH